MAIAVGTAANINNTATGTTKTITLPSAAAGDVIVLGNLVNFVTSDSVTSANLTWEFIGRSDNGGGAYSEAWIAVASGALTNEVISMNLSGNNSYITACVVNVSGLDTADPVDPNVNSIQTGTSGSRTISTTNPDTIVFGNFRSGGSATTTPAATWTGLDNNFFHMLEYKIFSSAQSGLTVPIMTENNSNGSVAFALTAAAGGATSKPWYYYAQQ